MFRAKLTSALMASAVLASIGLSNAARAEIVDYTLTFNSDGSSVGTATLSLDLPSANSTLVVGDKNNTSDFISLTGTIGGNQFTVSPSNFAGIFASQTSIGMVGGFTINDGQIEAISAPFGGQGIFAGNFLFFTGDGSDIRPGLDFEYGSVFGTVAVSGPMVAAVPEPSTWVMMILGFAGLGFLAYRQSRKRTVVLASA
ncbi:PEP-CTERM sorting domain-containing protein [Bradyrhizobium sp. dw_78]|uniref:PEP-CTERM sorting domain-containing protein n=1 Tax=Bradyrhizobium sp. dw_78 TaxID=2719793 RepID=UPI001BD3E4E5|nr:PEP-CTERM sorting domain-containing protein [Bradyrhizobium sp. dw_78]